MNFFIKYGFVTLLAAFGLYSCGPDLPESIEEEYAELPEKLDFNQHVKPILSDKCYLCHGPDKAKISAGLQLHSPETAFAELPETPGKYAIVPGNSSKSEMVARILSEDPNIVMPTPESHLSLTDHEKSVLIKWIEEGAEYKDHWAFIRPEKQKIPSIKKEDFSVNEIDAFVLEKLEEKGAQPSSPADKETLLRRISLDLTGLPPTIEDIDEFVNDTSPNAYEKQVDRLLSSKTYGEHMALGWMDLSRFADTHGYSVDRYRDMSPWRDWVIEAFNKNMPYDQFVTWQLAGDLMDNPTQEMKLATAFNRIHPQNMEGGIVNEEFLVEYAVDRASTVGQAFMGMTVACARCHDHKYDPISQKNFYELTSYFNNVNESGQISWDDAMPVPTMVLKSEEDEKMLAYVDELIENKEKEIQHLESEQQETFEQWLSAEQYHSLTKTPTHGLQAYYNLDNQSLVNKARPSHRATMKREYTEGQKVVLTDGKRGKALLLDGDTWLDTKKDGVFSRADEFTIALWAYIPKAVENGNIFHKGNGAILHNWRGYHLKITDNKLEAMLAHTAPDNAILTQLEADLPRDEWIHIAMSYDGSSKAKGIKVHINGEPQPLQVIHDNLYKDILFQNDNEPALQVGARLRGKGINEGKVDEIRVYDRMLTSFEIGQLSDNTKSQSVLAKSHDELSQNEKEELRSYYNQTISRKIAKPLSELAALRKQKVDSVETLQEVMVMKETPKPVQAYVLDRGVYDARGDKVYPNTPEAILPMPDSYPENRLGFAKWLFHKDHPLTARVAVNRIWQNFFGRGLVETSEDFGNQGKMPSHPELLDWLALEYGNLQWDTKALIKKIVMSGTYRQDSKAEPEAIAADPDNVWLTRGPVQRLTGEMLRDNVLFASGLLNTKIGGESVRPYQPPGLWKVNGMEYTPDSGEKMYRRSMYTIWKRSVPHPTLATFDAPNRDVCTIRRQQTNTPLQALLVLNDPTYIEAARVLGKEMAEESSAEKAIQKVFRKLTGRKPTTNEINVLTELQRSEWEKFKENTSKTKGWIFTGQYKIEEGEDMPLIAANAVVANTIMNTDAMIMKR